MICHYSSLFLDHYVSNIPGIYWNILGKLILNILQIFLEPERKNEKKEERFGCHTLICRIESLFPIQFSVKQASPS